MEDKVRSILRRYAGQNVEFAIDFDIEGRTLVSHLEALIQTEKEISYKLGKKSALTLAKDLSTSTKNRRELAALIEAMEK